MLVTSSGTRCDFFCIFVIRLVINLPTMLRILRIGAQLFQCIDIQVSRQIKKFKMQNGFLHGDSELLMVNSPIHVGMQIHPRLPFSLLNAFTFAFLSEALERSRSRTRGGNSGRRSGLMARLSSRTLAFPFAIRPTRSSLNPLNTTYGPGHYANANFGRHCVGYVNDNCDRLNSSLCYVIDATL